MARIVCVGLACLDYLFKVAELPNGGGKFFAEKYVAAPGGPAAAASITVSALGHDAVFLGRLGEDEVGHDLAAMLAKRGVDTSSVRFVKGQSSQVSSVIVDQYGERQIINYSSKQLDPDPSWLPSDIIAGADFLLTDVRWLEGAERALKIAAEHKVPSLIDADVSPVDTSKQVELANYVIFSEGGLQMYTGETELEKGLQYTQTKRAGWVAVTAGEKGSFWLTPDGTIDTCPVEPVTVIDTCGAGDVFHGAFAVARAENMDVTKAMRFAGITAALKCKTFGGSLGVPDRATVETYISKH